MSMEQMGPAAPAQEQQKDSLGKRLLGAGKEIATKGAEKLFSYLPEDFKDTFKLAYEQMTKKSSKEELEPNIQKDIAMHIRNFNLNVQAIVLRNE